MSEMRKIGEMQPIEYTAGGNFRTGLALDAHCDEMRCELGAMTVGEPGKLMFVSLLLRAVQPGKRVALAIRLKEEGTETPALLRTVTLPPNESSGPRDILVKEIPFVLPGHGKKEQRNFTAQAWAHYMDTDTAQASAL